MASLALKRLLLGGSPLGRSLRRAYWFVYDFSLPAPRVLVRPLMFLYVALREAWNFFLRVFICEPIFKAYCAKVGRKVRTGPFIQFVQGAGHIEVGDDVVFYGKSSFIFASRYSDTPMFSVGRHSRIGHNCTFTVGREVRIGEYCQMAGDVVIFDASGHPSEPAARERGEPAPLDTVKPVIIERNVWIGRAAMIFPGVTIGENSVIGARAVVTSSVPPNSFMMGNPARRVGNV